MDSPLVLLHCLLITLLQLSIIRQPCTFPKMLQMKWPWPTCIHNQVLVLALSNHKLYQLLSKQSLSITSQSHMHLLENRKSMRKTFSGKRKNFVGKFIHLLRREEACICIELWTLVCACFGIGMAHHHIAEFDMSRYFNFSPITPGVNYPRGFFPDFCIPVWKGHTGLDRKLAHPLL